MSREKKLIKNTIIYSLGSFGSKFLGFLILPLYTKYLSTSSYGYYDLIIITISLLCPIINLKLNDALFRFILGSNSEHEEKQIISNAFFIITRNILIFTIFYLFFAKFFINIKYSFLILIQFILFIISSMWLDICRAKKRNSLYSLSGIIGSSIILIMNLILILNTKMRVEALLISNILSYIFQIIFIEFKIRILKYIRLKLLNKETKKKLLSFSIPLIPAGLCWWIMSVSDRYMLKYFLGINSNGLYAVANKFPTIIILINSFFNLAWQETSITEHNSEDKDEFFSKIFNKIFVLSFNMAICLIAFNKFILNLMVDNKFSEAYMYMPLLYIGAVFSVFSSFYRPIYQSINKTKHLFYTVILGTIINIIINIIFIPKVGIQAASLSTMVSFLIVWLFRKYKIKKDFNIRINISEVLSLICLLCIDILIYYFFNNKIIIIINEIASLIILILYNYRLIKKGFKAFLKFIKQS